MYLLSHQGPIQYRKLQVCFMSWAFVFTNSHKIESNTSSCYKLQLYTLTLCYFVEFAKCILVVSLLNWPQMSTTPSLGVGHLIKGCGHCLHPMSTKWALGSESLDQGCGWSRWHSQCSLDSQSTALSLRGDSPVMIYIYPLFTAQWPPLFEYYRMLVPYATNRQDTLL